MSTVELPAGCPTGLDIRNIDQIIIKILKNYFTYAGKLTNERLRKFVYTDRQDTGIRIVMNSLWDPQKAGMTPAIIVKRGPQKADRIVINDRGEAYTGRQAIYDFARMITGEHKIIVTGAVDGETEELAQEVFLILTCLTPSLRGSIPFHDFQVAGISELVVGDATGHKFKVEIQIQYAYEYSWTVKELSPNLVQIGINSVIEQEQVSTDAGGIECLSVLP
jgi:hypothetical protein